MIVPGQNTWKMDWAEVLVDKPNCSFFVSQRLSIKGAKAPPTGSPCHWALLYPNRAKRLLVHHFSALSEAAVIVAAHRSLEVMSWGQRGVRIQATADQWLPFDCFLLGRSQNALDQRGQIAHEASVPERGQWTQKFRNNLESDSASPLVPTVLGTEMAELTRLTELFVGIRDEKWIIFRPLLGLTETSTFPGSPIWLQLPTQHSLVFENTKLPPLGASLCSHWECTASADLTCFCGPTGSLSCASTRMGWELNSGHFVIRGF